MKLRAFTLITTLTLGLLAAPWPVEAQKAGRVYRVGFLTVAGGRFTTEPFRQRMRELGYVEGVNWARAIISLLGYHIQHDGSKRGGPISCIKSA